MTESPLPVSAVLAAVPVHDLEVAEEFYARLFGEPASEHPMPSLTQWQTDGGLLQLVLDEQRAGGGLVTLVVDDLATVVADLAERGIDAGTVDGTVVTAFATVSDPDGNAVTLVEA